MVVVAGEGVNLQGLDRSTIGASAVAASVADWLRERSGRLPWPTRWGFALLPPRCLLCGGDGDLGAVDLCGACLPTLPFDAPLQGVELVPGAVFAPFTYDDPVGSGLRALKFHGDLRPARLFGALLAASAAVAGRPGAAGRPVLVPVPLHPDRHRARGFNQAELIARQAARWSGGSVRGDALRRIRPTAPQTALRGAARRRNLAAAFAPTAAAHRAHGGGHVILLDDVRTTGATLAAARAALRGSGLEVLDVWTVATSRRARQAARSA